MAVVAAACLLLAGCGATSAQEPEAGSEQVTERGPVSPDDVVLAGPTELEVVVSSCMGDPVVDELEEDDEQVRIRIVTAMLVGGEGPACADALTVTLDDPLDGRTVIDLVSGETLPVRPLDADTDSLAGLCDSMEVEWAEDEPGLDTADEAIEAFVANEIGLLSEATFEGQQILYEDEVVGRLSVTSVPAGGYLVTSAEWCYPDGY